jgi:hypothetical protein
MIAVLCNEKGDTLLGSDGYFHVDGRYSKSSQINLARQYRERYKLNFQQKYESWTHVMFVACIRDLPDQYNNRSIPARYKL